MNNSRRKEIRAIIAKLEEVKECVENVRDEEQEYLDNMPENLQCSERADVAQNAIDNMEYALDNLEEAVDNLEEAEV